MNNLAMTLFDDELLEEDDQLGSENDTLNRLSNIAKKRISKKQIHRPKPKMTTLEIRRKIEEFMEQRYYHSMLDELY